MLMNLETLDWDDVLLDAMGVPRAMLPEIRPSMEVYGEAGGALAGLPVAAALGDQHAALFGQTCFEPGDAKCTYGTGSFLLMNTGTKRVASSHGLLTTVGYKIGEQDAVYCLEGAIAVTGSLVQWLRDNLGLISSAPEIEHLAGLERGGLERRPRDVALVHVAGEADDRAAGVAAPVRREQARERRHEVDASVVVDLPGERLGLCRAADAVSYTHLTLPTN